MRNTEWSDLQNTTAKGLWRDGVDARTIGGRVGKSRMAVIGRADREGWGAHPHAPETARRWRRASPGSAVLTLHDGGRR